MTSQTTVQTSYGSSSFHNTKSILSQKITGESPEIPEEKTNFLDSTIFKTESFYKDSIFYTRTHFKSTKTFQNTHFFFCHAPGVRKGFISSQAITLLRTNSSKVAFGEGVGNFTSRLRLRGYLDNQVNKVLAEAKFTVRKSALQQKSHKVQNGLISVVTQYNQLVPSLKHILMSK